MFGRDETIGIAYDFSAFSVLTASTDYDLKSNVAALFLNVKVAKNISIIFDQDISIKFNSTLLPAITLLTSDSPFQFPTKFIDIKNIFLSNSSGSTVNIKILLW